VRRYGWAGVLVLGIVAVAAAVLLWQRATPRDDFDYASAFELPTDGQVPAMQIDVAGFAGAPRVQAEQVLGAPQHCETAMASERCRYRNGVEVVYIDERADWITVQLGYGRYALAPQTLAAVGLPVVEPGVVNQHQLVWSGHAGFKTLQLVGDENGAMYLRIKALHG
jgi:hypothetical protein